MTTTPETPDRAWKLIEQTGWTQEVSARNKDGCALTCDSLEAVCFCTIGALARVYNPKSDKYEELLEQVATHLDAENCDFYPFHTISQWNDHPGRTKEEVLTLLKTLDI